MSTSTGRIKKLSAADFLEALEARLTAMKPAELRAALMTHAETLPAAERGAFLAIFEGRREAGKAAEEQAAGRARDREKLLRDIDALVEQCGEKHYGGREHDWGEEGEDDDWDHSELPQAMWPRGKIDALFERTDAVFRAGDLALARDAYERLFDLISSYGEDGFEADEEESEPVGATDLEEAKARYLRALYETTELAQRPAALLKVLQDLQYVGGPAALPEMTGARRSPLPDREAFLAAWIELLRQHRSRSDAFGFDIEARRLLFQAVRLHQGTEGLAELARREGRRIPEAYREWVQALAEEGQTGEAARAAQGALQALPPKGEIRAWVAEFLAEAAAKNDDGPARLDGRREAFRATPTLARLSFLCEAAEPLGQLKAVVHAETAQVRATVARQSRQQGQDPVERQRGQRLLATLLLLDGETEEAIALAQRAPAVGWSGGEHPGPVVMPYLLCAAAGRAEPAAGTALAELWRGIDADELRFPLWDLGTLDGDFEDEPEAPWPDTSPTRRPVRLTPFLRTQIERQPVDPEERTRFLKVAWTLAERRVKEILDKKHRRAYERAAMLVGAVAEARIMAGDTEGGNALLSNVHQQFSRFSAFTRELDKATRRSPLLPSPSPKPRRW